MAVYLWTTYKSKQNSGNAHRNDQYTPVSFGFKISQKSQIVNVNKQQKIHYGNTDGFVDGKPYESHMLRFAKWVKKFNWFEKKASISNFSNTDVM